MERYLRTTKLIAVPFSRHNGLSLAFRHVGSLVEVVEGSNELHRLRRVSTWDGVSNSDCPQLMM